MGDPTEVGDPTARRSEGDPTEGDLGEGDPTGGDPTEGDLGGTEGDPTEGDLGAGREIQIRGGDPTEGDLGGDLDGGRSAGRVTSTAAGEIRPRVTSGVTSTGDRRAGEIRPRVTSGAARARRSPSVGSYRA